MTATTSETNGTPVRDPGKTDGKTHRLTDSGELGCGMWGAYWMRPVPADVTVAEDDKCRRCWT